jgi:hypothetical protein
VVGEKDAQPVGDARSRGEPDPGELETARCVDRGPGDVAAMQRLRRPGEPLQIAGSGKQLQLLADLARPLLDGVRQGLAVGHGRIERLEVG